MHQAASSRASAINSQRKKLWSGDSIGLPSMVTQRFTLCSADSKQQRGQLSNNFQVNLTKRGLKLEVAGPQIRSSRVSCRVSYSHCYSVPLTRSTGRFLRCEDAERLPDKCDLLLVQFSVDGELGAIEHCDIFGPRLISVFLCADHVLTRW
jgi:hypothetical protein